jgi:site-specific recombinase XerD
MDLNVAIARFLNSYFSTHERRAKTKAAYVCDLDQFRLFVGPDIALDQIGHEQIEGWAANLKAKAYSPASTRRKLIVLKVFFGHLVRQGALLETPFRRVRVCIGKAVQLPRALSADEIKALLVRAHKRQVCTDNQSPNQTSSKQFLFLRNRALVELLFATGMRVGEVSGLDLTDMAPNAGVFKIRGKAGRERMAFIVDVLTATAQNEYLRARHQISTDTEALFLNHLGYRLSPQGIANVLAKFRADIGIQRKVTPHMLRHTIATLLLRNGVDIRVVQEFLGHASIATTQRYTHVSKEHLISELGLRHPSLEVRRQAVSDTVETRN